MRRGVVSLWVISVLAVMSVLLAAALDLHFSNRKTIDERKQRAQADLAMRSGLDLAMAQLLTRADYQGETKEVTPAFKVAVKVKSLGKNQYEVSAQVEPAEEGRRGLRRSGQWQVERTQKGKDVDMKLLP